MILCTWNDTTRTCMGAQSSVSLMLLLQTKEIRVATGRLIMIIVLEWKRYEKFSYLHHVPLQISRNTMTLVFLIVKSAYFRTPDTCSQFAFDGVINSTSISSDFLLKYDPITLNICRWISLNLFTTSSTSWEFHHSAPGGPVIQTVNSYGGFKACLVIAHSGWELRREWRKYLVFL